MRWLLTEYILKGIYLGLLCFVALEEPSWAITGQVALFVIGGLCLAVAVAAGMKLREGYRVHGRLAAFVLFLLLESPGLIYAGIIMGMVLGIYSIRQPGEDPWLLAALGGGALLGVIFYVLRHVTKQWLRFSLSLVLAVALVGGALYSYQHAAWLQDPLLRHMLGVRLLLGIPIFYLLTFAGTAEESEVEIGAICASLGVAGCMLARDSSTALQSIAYLVPVVLYFLYTTRILPGLRVFKHVMRGMSYSKIGEYRPALLSLRRALQLDPKNSLARESLWSMHRAMNMEEVVKDPETLKLIDLDLCLERVNFLLLLGNPGPEKLQEAHRLLNLILDQRPAMAPAIHYWRAVAYTHARQYEQAAGELEKVLDGQEYAPGDPHREPVLLSAWQLGLLLHPELNRRVGGPQLGLPGRRLEAIGAAERRLVINPEDSAAWDLKRLLYGHLTEVEYRTAVGGDRAANDFDHGYVHQLGLALINDPVRWQRGVEYLRMAARGLLQQAPTIFMQIAQTHERMGPSEAVWQYYELAKRAGQAVGPKKLAEADRQAYFQAVKLLADETRGRGDIDAAIENFQLYAEFERSGIETLRILAELYERKGEVLSALRVTDQGLVYNSKDKDLLERKDRYYFSVTPDDLRARLETAKNGFDVEYCLRKAKSLLDFRDTDLDVVEWAQHLADLAQVVEPENRVAKVLRARALRRRGEIDQSQALLEDVYANKPEKFPSNAEEEAWYLACRLLGEMYLNELGKPELAVPCFKNYRQSSKSGADTMYKLGQAYEQLGDRKLAAKYYEHVTAYEGHPLAMDAHDALHRMQS